MFKKIIILLFLFFFIYSLILLTSNNKITTTFSENQNENNNEDYTFYDISLEKVNITTRNIDKYFSKISIVGLYPYFDKTYEIKLEKIIGYYIFQYNDLNKNINEFTKYYEQILKNNGIIIDSIVVNGIRIKKVRIYSSYGELSNLLEKNPNFSID